MKQISTPGHMINWFSTTIRLDPERLGASYEEWLKTDDIYILGGITVSDFLPSIVTLYVGKASDCKVDGNRLILPVPEYIDIERKDFTLAYVTNMKHEDFMGQINRNVDEASKKEGDWWAPAGSERGVIKDIANG